MRRKLFCEINPLTYKISVAKERLKRNLIWKNKGAKYAQMKIDTLLPILIYRHASLIRRTLGDVDMQLQENKAMNLSLAAPRITNILILPGETFSFWHIVGNSTRRKGYLNGLIIKNGKIESDTGGGMCQFTNLIHWMVLHSPLDIIEHHHHNSMDLFPDFNRQIPFGTGTSIMYNYLDYQFKNNTDYTFQLVTYTTDTHLHGELRCTNLLDRSYHIVEEDHFFSMENDGYYRNNKIFRNVVDKNTGNIITKEFIIENHSKVMYNRKYITNKAGHI